MIYDTAERRGRAPGEIPRLLGSRLPAGVPYDYAADQHEGLRKAWQRTRRGDRLIVILDHVGDALHDLQAIAEDAACFSPITAEAGVA